jgi:hypothetical protein
MRHWALVNDITGKIEVVGFGDDEPPLKPDWVCIWDEQPSLTDDYWDGTEFLPREAMALTVDGATITGFPDGSTLRVSGPVLATFDDVDSPAELDLPVAGEYRIEIIPPTARYLPATVEVVA